MKILKHGRKLGKANCWKCDSTLKYKEYDITEVRTGNTLLDGKYIRCPICNTKITVGL